MKNKTSLVILGALVLLIPVFAQTQQARLTIQSLPQGAEVYLNNRYAGITPLREVAVEAGRIVVRVVYPGATAWNAAQKVDSILLNEGESAFFEADLGLAFTLVTIPPAVRVIAGEQELGITPLSWRGGSMIDVELRKEGYETAMISLPQLLQGVPVVRLKQQKGPVMVEEVLSPDLSNGLRKTVPVYVSAAALIASGIVAAALKERADKEFEIYQRTLEPSRRITTERLDRQSGIALTVMQISFASLAYFLLLE
jgi:hypothetical protein